MPNLISVRQINNAELNSFCATTFSSLITGTISGGGSTVLPYTVPVFRLDIVNLTGLGINSIDSLTTLSIDLNTSPSLYFFKTAVSSGIQGWQLISGINPEAPNSGYIRPNDFNISSNPKVWLQVM